MLKIENVIENGRSYITACHRMAHMSFAASIFIGCRDYLLTGFNEALNVVYFRPGLWHFTSIVICFRVIV